MTEDAQIKRTRDAVARAFRIADRTKRPLSRQTWRMGLLCAEIDRLRRQLERL